MKFFIGPVSKNTVWNTIDMVNFSFIPSCRQIDFCGGYVGWDTQEFAQLVPIWNAIERDHGGPGQGDNDYIESLTTDSQFFDYIHIDPWKVAKDFQDGLEQTKELVEMCYNLNPRLKFEIGTEEAIYPFTLAEYGEMLSFLYKNCEAWDAIEYVVVQSGVKLDLPNMKNVGTYDKLRLHEQIKMVNGMGKSTKEHNGDYLTKESLISRQSAGVSAVNIAPELGQLETLTIYNNISSYQRKKFFNICQDYDYRWNKWVTSDISNKQTILTAGHYIFNEEPFLEFKSDLKQIDRKIEECQKKYLQVLLSISQQ